MLWPQKTNSYVLFFSATPSHTNTPGKAHIHTKTQKNATSCGQTPPQDGTSCQHRWSLHLTSRLGFLKPSSNWSFDIFTANEKAADYLWISCVHPVVEVKLQQSNVTLPHQSVLDVLLVTDRLWAEVDRSRFNQVDFRWWQCCDMMLLSDWQLQSWTVLLSGLCLPLCVCVVIFPGHVSLSNFFFYCCWFHFLSACISEVITSTI